MFVRGSNGGNRSRMEGTVNSYRRTSGKYEPTPFSGLSNIFNVNNSTSIAWEPTLIAETRQIPWEFELRLLIAFKIGKKCSLMIAEVRLAIDRAQGGISNLV